MMQSHLIRLMGKPRVILGLVGIGLLVGVSWKSWDAGRVTAPNRVAQAPTSSSASSGDASRAAEQGNSTGSAHRQTDLKVPQAPTVSSATAEEAGDVEKIKSQLLNALKQYSAAEQEFLSRDRDFVLDFHVLESQIARENLDLHPAEMAALEAFLKAHPELKADLNRLKDFLQMEAAAMWLSDPRYQTLNEDAFYESGLRESVKNWLARADQAIGYSGSKGDGTASTIAEFLQLVEERRGAYSASLKTQLQSSAVDIPPAVMQALTFARATDLKQMALMMSRNSQVPVGLAASAAQVRKWRNLLVAQYPRNQLPPELVTLINQMSPGIDTFR